MSKTFLGINSLKVLKKYIDDQILLNEENTRWITLHVYKYVEFKDGRPDKPVNGAFNPENATITYPAGWNSLSEVINNLKTGEEVTDEDVSVALAKGSIWMSVGVAEGNSAFSNWSLPIRISGQNGADGKDGADGITIEFRWTYDDTLTENDIDSMSVTPLSPNSDKRNVWVWSKYTAEEVWHKSLWAVYAIDASDVLYRYCVTSTMENPGAPSSDVDSKWTTSASASITSDVPYMWMTWKRVPAGSVASEIAWNEPILFGHYGQDGVTGEDGITPDYNVTLYKLGDGFVTPDKPIQNESDTLDELKTNNPEWYDLPIKPEIVNLAAADEVYVTSEDEIKQNIKSDAKIVLNADIELSRPIEITSNITVYLNNHKLTAGTFAESGGVISEGTSDSYVFWVKDGGNLIINGNGEVRALEANYSMAVWVNGGDATINGGNYYNAGDNCDLIYISKSGTVTINGGYFEATDKIIVPGGGTGYKRSALNIKNADIEKCKFIVYGGSFLDFDPSNLDKEVGGITSFVPDHCTCTVVDGKFVIVDTNKSPDIWWQCTVKVNGNTNEIIGISDVCRYSAVDGNAKPGQYTKYEFCWSTDQNVPALPDWTTSPIYDSTNQDGSLWMHFADVIMNTNTGELEFLSDWSEPIKLTGPRGPIAHDYRLETRYNNGTATKPNKLPNDDIWSKNAPPTTSQYPYVWAKNYLVLYKMKYDDLGDVVVDDSKGIDVIEEYNHFRLSGLNGEDGNKKNSIMYSNTASTLDVTSFAENNLYISNTSENTIYNIKLDTLSFIDGYTGKFANIGTGLVTIDAGKFKFVGSCTEASTIDLNPQESVELICYNNGDIKELIVIGKAL